MVHSQQDLDKRLNEARKIDGMAKDSNMKVDKLDNLAKELMNEATEETKKYAINYLKNIEDIDLKAKSIKDIYFKYAKFNEEEIKSIP